MRKKECYIFGLLQIVLAFLISIFLGFYFVSPKEALIPCAFFLSNITSGVGLLAISNNLGKVIENDVRRIASEK
jgi:hypothetical protein